MRNASPEWRTHRSMGLTPRGAVAAPEPPSGMRVVADEEAASGGPQPWRRTRWTLLFVTFLAYVFVVTTSRFPLGKAVMVGALLGLLLEGSRVRFAPMLGWLGGFVIWATIGVAASTYPEASFDDAIELGKVWLIVLVAVNALTDRVRIRMYMIAYAGFFAIYPVRGTILNYLTGNTYFGRAAWNYMFANPNDLAVVTLLQFSMVAGMLAAGVRGWVRWACVAGTMILPLVILLTQSRAAIIALAVVAIALAVTQRGLLRPSSFVKIVLLLGLLAYLAPSGVWDRVRRLRHATSTAELSEVDAEGSARQRFEIWKIATDVASDHPVFGVGLGLYPKVHARYALSEKFDPSGRGERDAHSTYLTVLAETGVIGALILAGLIASVAVFADRVRRRSKTALPKSARQLLYLELGLLGLLIAGIWGSYAQLTYVYLHLVLLWCFADVTRRDLERLSAMRARGPALAQPR
jgi:putative inorganic carbon (hco3(-)) transporter